MEWKKATPELVAAFQSVAPGGPEAEERKMFGYSCAFVHGNMFMGLHGDGFVLRLAPEDRAALAEQGGQPFEPMPGRAMREYVLLPPALYEDAARLREWVRRAYEYGSALPAKAPKPKRAAKKTTA